MRKITRLYHIWSGMKDRCRNPNSPAYHWYGGRGISYHNDWELFDNFEKWAFENGYNNSLTIDRIDTNGNYCPNNCRFVDMKTQNNNRRDNILFTIDGETKTLQLWCEQYKIHPNTVTSRIRRFGWPIEDALATPARFKKQNLVGQRFGRWVVINRAESSKTHRGCRWLCRCDCGEIKVVSQQSLKAGTSRSCGCLLRESSKKRSINSKRNANGTYC